MDPTEIQAIYHEICFIENHHKSNIGLLCTYYIDREIRAGFAEY